MLRILRSRSRSLYFPRKNRPFCSNAAARDARDAAALAASSSLAVPDQTPSTEIPDPPPSWSSRILKFGIFGSLAGASAAAGYATYAYTPEEVEEKLKAFQASENHSIDDNASAFDKFRAYLYSTSVTVTAEAIEFYLDLRRSIEEHVRNFTEPSAEKLLPDLHPMEQNVFTLVLDLNETLVFSDWNRDRGWRTFKRPGVDAFLEHLAQFYEIVVYSDQPSMYVDPVIERLDKKGCIRYRLGRTATRYEKGKHYRDLSKLNRDPSRILYVSGHALESSLQPDNCVPIKAWKSEADDTVLLDLLPFLEYVARNRPSDIRQVLASYKGLDIPTEFIQRSKEHQRRMLDQKQRGPFWRR